MAPPPRDRSPTFPGRTSPLPGARPAILEAASDHDVLRDLAGVVYERVLPVVEDLAAALPDLMTITKCNVARREDHPGPRHWLVLVAIIVPILGGAYGAWRTLVRPILDRLEAVSLASQFPREPRVIVQGEAVLFPSPPQIVLPAASAKKKVRTK